MDDIRRMIPEVSHEDEQIYFYLWDTQTTLMLRVERVLFPCQRTTVSQLAKGLNCRVFFLRLPIQNGKPLIMEHYYASKKKIMMDYLKVRYPNILFEIKMTGEYRGKKIRKEFS